MYVCPGSAKDQRILWECTSVGAQVTDVCMGNGIQRILVNPLQFVFKEYDGLTSLADLLDIHWYFKRFGG